LVGYFGYNRTLLTPTNRPKGDAFVARSHPVAEGHCSRCHCHQAQAPSSLSFPSTSQGGRRHLRYQRNSLTSKLSIKIVNIFFFCFSAGEWWKSDTEAVINQAMKSGLAPNVSDAHTINGHPGPMSTCASLQGIEIHKQRTILFVSLYFF